MLLRVVPDDFFRPLTSPGAQVYLAILLELFTQTKAHQEPLSREFAASLIYDLIAAPDKLALTTDAVIGDEIEADDKALARASAILRYLERCGWLRSETQKDFTQTFILPDYAFRILRTLHEINSNDPPPLAGLICTIHDLLRAALEENADVRLPEAHRQTHALTTCATITNSSQSTRRFWVAARFSTARSTWSTNRPLTVFTRN